MVGNKRLVGIGIAAAVLLATGSPTAHATDGRLRVATYNQYLGADIAPLITASAATFNGALLGVLEEVAANRFPARAGRQAALIADAAPDLVGLQEVWSYDCQDLPPTPGACASPSIRAAFVDQLALTLAALRARGADYRVAALVRNFDTAEIELPIPGGSLRGLPFSIGGKRGVLLAKDQDVILARRDLDTRPVVFDDCRVAVDGCIFDNILRLRIPAFPGVEVEYKRGFVGVDVSVRGRRYRFINTHLEVEEPEPGNPLSMFFQSAQAAELIAALAAKPLQGRELVLVGDMNSSPTDVSPGTSIIPPYRQFAAAGFLDAWNLSGNVLPGFTCCQAGDLDNVRSELFKRIDLILVGTRPVRVRAIERLGESVADKTVAQPGRPALWPSDHAGVAAAVSFP